MRANTAALLPKNETHLVQFSNQLIEELQQIVNGSWGLYKTKQPEDVRQLDIEVFIDGFRLVMYAMDKSNTQLGHKTLMENVPEGLLMGDDINPNLDDYDFSNEEDNNDLDAFDKAQQEIFISWFRKCWAKVDTSGLTKPIQLMFHHSGECLDL